MMAVLYGRKLRGGGDAAEMPLPCHAADAGHPHPQPRRSVPVGTAGIGLRHATFKGGEVNSYASIRQAACQNLADQRSIR